MYISIQWSINLLLLGISTVLATRTLFERNQSRNRLTMLPYYLACLFLLVEQVLLTMKIIHFSSLPETNLPFVLSSVVISSFYGFLWTLVTLWQLFNWDIITLLLVFQARFDLSELDVVRHDFN